MLKLIIYTLDNGPAEVIKQINENGKVFALEENITTYKGKKFTSLLSVIPILFNDEECYIGMTVDITKQKNMENEIRNIYKQTSDSIEYASLIQHTLIPDSKGFKYFFNDHFTIWHPRDSVGGDIYLFREINNNECLIYTIDCTGHGVPGAFVTMLVKAIEQQVNTVLVNNNFIDIGTAWVLSYFNKTMKYLLNQQNAEEAISNVGFDGGILYYNKSKKLIKYSSAQTPLFYFDKEGELQMIKGDRYSVGYVKSDSNYEFEEYEIEVEEGMQFYISTDGYLDQKGGPKGFPLGKKKFKNLLTKIKDKPMIDQQKELLCSLDEYQGDMFTVDDKTVIGIKI